jgi:tetratricopeptide (TPR) repeat protein
LTATSINTDMYSFIFINGDISCNSLATTHALVFVNGDVNITIDLNCFGEDHEVVNDANLHVTGIVTVQSIFTWFYDIPNLKYKNPSQIIAIHSGFESFKHLQINQLFHEDIPLYLKPELLHQREQSWSDEILFKLSENGKSLIKEYLVKGIPVFIEGVTLEGIQLQKQAQQYLDENDYVKAKKIALQAIEVSPKLAGTYFIVGESLKTEKEYKDAIHYYKKILEINPIRFDAMDEIARCYCQLEDYRQALIYANKSLEESIKIDVINAYVYRIRGECYLKLNDEANAMQDFNRAIQSNPNMVMAYYYRGMIHYKNNKIDEAKADYKKVKKINPNFDKGFYDESN